MCPRNRFVSFATCITPRTNTARRTAGSPARTNRPAPRTCAIIVRAPGWGKVTTITDTKGRTKAEAGALLDDARALLGSTATRASSLQPVTRSVAQDLHRRARDFHNEFETQPTGPLRTIHSWSVLLVEEGLALYVAAEDSPAAGYKLAADFCQHYESRHGNCLCGPSPTKVMEVVRFMFTLEAIEEEQAR